MRRPPSRWRSALSGLELTGVTVTRSGADGSLRLQLAQPPCQPAAPGHELLLQRGDLVPAAADQFELAVDVSHRLVEDLAAADRLVDAASPLASQGSPGALGARQLTQLLERDAEQLLEAQQLAQPLHVRALVESVRARRPAAGGREQADLLVVADRARRGPRRLGHLADPQQSLVLRAHRLTPGGREPGRGPGATAVRRRPRAHGGDGTPRPPRRPARWRRAPTAPCACWR